MSRGMSRSGAVGTLTCLIGLAVMCGTVGAQEPEIVLQEEAELACGETLRLDLPDRPEPGEKVFLSFRARIQARFESGSAAALQVAVNGLPTSIERLRNKPHYYVFSGYRRVE